MFSAFPETAVSVSENVSENVNSVLAHYSLRSAVSGSNRAARQAGWAPAANATASSTVAPITRVLGSAGATPYNRLEMSGPAASAAGMPRARPARARIATWHRQWRPAGADKASRRYAHVLALVHAHVCSRNGRERERRRKREREQHHTRLRGANRLSSQLRIRRGRRLCGVTDRCVAFFLANRVAQNVQCGGGVYGTHSA